MSELNYVADSDRLLSMLRNIPGEVLLPLVQDPHFAHVVLATHAPLPESVFTYLHAEYRAWYEEIGAVTEWPIKLYARPLTALQRAVVFATETNAYYLEPLFKYNALTHEELLSLNKHLISEKSATDLLRYHRKDKAALAIIAELLSKDHMQRIKESSYRYSKQQATITGSSILITAKELSSYLKHGVQLEISESLTTVYSPFPMRTSVLRLWSDRQRTPTPTRPQGIRDLALPYYDAAPITHLLGTNVFVWLAFLRMLDSAPTFTPVDKIATTVLRSRTKDHHEAALTSI